MNNKDIRAYLIKLTGKSLSMKKYFSYTVLPFSGEEIIKSYLHFRL